jgi:glycosyltransferase involved in cell wall biosynthesis
LEKILYLFRKNKYDACLIGVLPWEFYFIVPFIKEKCRTVLDISDPLYKNAFFDKGKSPLYKKMEGKALRCADNVIVMNEMTIDMYVEEMGVDRNKLIYLPPATDTSGYLRNQYRKFCLDKPIKLLYSGALYPGYRDLYEVVKALDSVNGYQLDVVTRHGYTDTEAVHYHEWMPHEKMVATYQEYDILLFVDNFYGYQVPSKIFELIATNKPILFVYDRRNMYLYNLLKNQQGIIFVENNRDMIKACLEELIRNRHISVNYKIDLTPYSSDYINESLLNVLLVNK